MNISKYEYRSDVNAVLMYLLLIVALLMSDKEFWFQVLFGVLAGVHAGVSSYYAYRQYEEKERY